jgi:hypothetical protein
MLDQLAPYQERLESMQRLITEMMDAKGSRPGQGLTMNMMKLRFIW